MEQSRPSLMNNQEELCILGLATDYFDGTRLLTLRSVM
jgi:hypothetical protein